MDGATIHSMSCSSAILLGWPGFQLPRPRLLLSTTSALTSALGLCLPAPLQGIIVTTRRGLHIQRFTAAHELGHVILEHRGSIDREILERGPLAPSDGRDLQEVAADAFAAEFLLPRWLFRHHIQSQGWTVSGHLRNPDIVYQLSLRMGVSYEATCWSLLGHHILPKGEVDELRKIPVARLKSRLSGEFKPGNSWADVWRLNATRSLRTARALSWNRTVSSFPIHDRFELFRAFDARGK
jgi:Zn-dependent peptidase ImmA (M78 family)